MIIVTGATGKLGSRVVDQLLKRLPAEQVGVSVREPAQAQHLADRGVSVRRGDFADPATLAEAFAGADQVLVVSAGKLGDEGRVLHRAAFAAAAQASVGRVLYTSHMGVNPDSPFPPMPAHAAHEAELAAAGVPWTSLRNGFYSSTVPMLAGQAAQTGQLIAPEDGPVSWTTHDDLAEATAVVLCEPDRFDGPTPPLTAAEAIDLTGVAAIMSELSGRPVQRITVADDEWVATMTQRGMTEPQIRMTLGIFQAARRGDFAAVDPAMEKLLGRRPQSVREVLSR
ncbi:NAD(P)H-binding protein [Actinoplanes sp. TFC3]|uniref:NAD(P)H-binding protein n=1 Tax=Actinoplanes sp. TFC3 TaxID=1710355 RepID=UPI000830E7D7|nr:NAD(P)H-binding protein [Actinoplanes sp. TFC3]